MRSRASRRHLRALARGVPSWNAWRDEKEIRPKLAGADLRGADLRNANLSFADLRNADLSRAALTGANLWKADLEGADLRQASLRDALLDEASVARARVEDADFTGASFRETRWTDLSGARGVEPLLGPDPDAEPQYATEERPTGELAAFVRVPIFTAPLVKHPRAPSSPEGLCLFVSYAGTDAGTAQALINALETAGHVCWDYLSDPVREAEPDQLTVELIGRLLGSDALVVLTSPRSASRPWVGHEVTVADHHAKRYVRVVMTPSEYENRELEARRWGHFVMLDPSNLRDTARRAEAVLRDESRWGVAQRLGPSA